jgi:CDP-glycerol glycerophosphotransferase (TagB/SpsB family)
VPHHIRTKLVIWALAALSPLVFLIDRMVPKRRNLWVFGLGRPNQWHGNAQAVYEAVRDRPDIEAVVAARRVVPESLDASRDRILIGVRSLPALLRAGVIIVHHGRGDLPFTGISPHRRSIVNVWHGIPLKGILYTGWNDLGRRAMREVRTYARFFSSVIASSDVDRLAMSASTHLPLGNVWVTGLPRNDWLLASSEDLPSDVADAVTRLRAELGGRRLVLYAPTFRDEGSGIYPFDAGERAALASVLETRGAVLGVRTHINEPGAAALASEDWALDISPSRFPETQAVLRCTDVLVSDYSSIWIDFLLLDRPIIGLVHDLEDYAVKRHLLYDIRRVYGGPLVITGAELAARLDAALTGADREEHDRLRATAREVFHTYTDAGATVRTVNRILREQGSDHAV